MFSAQRIPYEQAQVFSKIVLDYLNDREELRPFYSARPDLSGLLDTLKAKQNQSVDRELLVRILKDQYRSVETQQAVAENIESLSSSQTFTITTAHQPNLFTGPLYFIYKILHAIRIAETLNLEFREFHFVPVYYMGSEDADFAELNHTYVNGQRIEWKKQQSGAVGRMRVDHTLVSLIGEIEGQLAGEPFGADIIGLLRKCYTTGKTIQEATFEIVNELYGKFGLIVLIPDRAELKAVMKPVFLQELFEHRSAELVSTTSEALNKHYNTQAHPRDINLFYLKDNIRERIIREGGGFTVNNTELVFSDAEMRRELDTHPERFSPNVILRGLFQESILPNIAFVGGGGELAYWLQLRSLFELQQVVYPVLILRNSFLIVDEKWMRKVNQLDLPIVDFFRSENEIMTRVVEKRSTRSPHLNGQMQQALRLYEELREQAGQIDPTLAQHVDALRARSVRHLEELEKKMLRAEKRKFTAEQSQIKKIREVLFPRNGLQERVENFSSFYARWGKAFIDELCRHSPALEQQFTILTPAAEAGK